jgi:plasmid stability protein
MPVSITIRDVPDETRDELAARAAATGRSLQEYVRAQLIRLASQPDAEALLARVRERIERTGSRLSAKTILELRGLDRK